MSLKEEISRVEKQFGKGTIMKLGDESLSEVEVISTGVPALDYALGVGGLPRGRITEIFGPPGGGKSTIAQQVIAQAQAKGGIVAYVDAEHSLDPSYARALGVNIDDLYISQPDYGEQGLEITQAFVKSGEIDVVVVDSVASLVPKAEIEGSIGDQYMGLQARMMSQALRMLVSDVHNANAVVLMVNQTRQKIGVVYGNPETTPGGTALAFYSGVRIRISSVSPIKESDQVVGMTTKAKVIKNKVAPPLKECTFEIIYGQGSVKEGGLIDVGEELGLIDRSGAWLTIEGERFQGRDNAIARLRENKDLAGKLEVAIREKLAK
jgi:recombination protein RecA